MKPLLTWFPYLVTLAAAVAPAAASSAQVEPRVPSSFALVAAPPTSEGEQLARGTMAFLKFDVQPIQAVTLGESIPDAIASQFGAKREVPFDTKLRLYGWPERPGLYCDLMRWRGMYISAACLQDTDGDGDFDEGRRLDFHHLKSDILGVTANNKVVGMRFSKIRVPLPAPVAYTPVTPAGEATGKMVMRWRRHPDKASGRDLAQLEIATHDTSTGTAGEAENVLIFDRSKVPMDVEYYGIRLRIHGFAEDGQMRYTLLGMTDGVRIPILFRRAATTIMIYH